MAYEIKKVFDFLKLLKYNNKTEWMHEHREEYLAAKEVTIRIAQETLGHLSSQYPWMANADARRLLYRINRDTRFSLDKSTYYTHMGFWLPTVGIKKMCGGFLIYLQPEDEDGNYFTSTMICAGLYNPPSKMAKEVREEIDEHGDRLRAIINSKEFKEAGWEIYDKERLKVLPKHLKGSEYEDLISLKNWSLWRSFTEEEVLREDFIPTVMKAFDVAVAWNNFFDPIVKFVQEEED